MVYKVCPFNSVHMPHPKTTSELHSVHVHEMSSAQHHNNNYSVFLEDFFQVFKIRTKQARSQKLLLGGSFGQNVDLFGKIVDLLFYKIEDILNKISYGFLNKIVDLFNKLWTRGGFFST